MTTYLGSSHPRELHIDSVANDAIHDTAISEIKAKQPDARHSGSIPGYTYATFFEDDKVILKWDGQSVTMRVKQTNFVKFVFSSRQYSTSTERICSPGQDYYMNAQTYSDSSYWVNDIAEINIGDYDQSYGYPAFPEYFVKIHRSYYNTRWEVTKYDP